MSDNPNPTGPATSQAKETHSTIIVHNIDQLKEIFDSGESPAVRSARSWAITSTHSTKMDAEKDLSAEALTKRVEAHLLGDTPLSEIDRKRLERVFPMTVTSITADDKGLPDGYVWNLGTSTSPVTVQLGTLTMNPGSSIRIQNTVLKFTVDTLIRQAGGQGAPYDIGISARLDRREGSAAKAKLVERAATGRKAPAQ